MSQEEDVKNAINNVNNFLNNAKEIMAQRMEEALRKIASVKWYQGDRARDLAEEALGIGKYWNKE